MPIRLTFPGKSHRTEDLRPLYEEFKRQSPERFEEWVEIENKGTSIGPNDLKKIQQEVYDFLRTRVEYTSEPALIMAFFDFRYLAQEDSDRGVEGRERG